jgi:hypothetical protein
MAQTNQARTKSIEVSRELQEETPKLKLRNQLAAARKNSAKNKR